MAAGTTKLLPAISPIRGAPSVTGSSLTSRPLQPRAAGSDGDPRFYTYRQDVLVRSCRTTPRKRHCLLQARHHPANLTLMTAGETGKTSFQTPVPHPDQPRHTVAQASTITAEKQQPADILPPSVRTFCLCHRAAAPTPITIFQRCSERCGMNNQAARTTTALRPRWSAEPRRRRD